jgi:hypothetical protein
MSPAPHDLEDRIRTSLHRTAGQAPPADDLLGRARREIDDPQPRTARWRGTVIAGLAAAAVAGVMVASVTLFDGSSGPGPSEDPVVVPVNPSTKPDFALCDSLADKVGGDDGGDLVRAVTVKTSRLESWLPGPLSTYEHLDASAPTTTICVYRTAPQPVPGPPRADSDGIQVLAQSAERWDVRSIGPVDSVFADLDPLQREIREEFDNQPIDGITPPKKPGEPCIYARPVTLPRMAADRAEIRVPDTTVANPDSLVSVWDCSGTPALHYPGVDVYFEDGYPVRSRDEVEQDVADSMRQFEGSSAYVATAFGVPVEVYQPVDGTLGEVLYVVEGGHLMRVLGDGSIPADQLLEVVTSSEPLGDRTLP